MFASVAAFEFRQQLKNPVFWVAGALFFLLTFASVTVDQVQIGARGATHANSPYAIALTHLTMGVFFMFVTTAFVADVVVRDDNTGFGPILRTTRLSKRDYLYGRFTGAIGAAALAFLFVPLAMMLGSLMPWVDKDKLGPFLPGAYAYSYLVWALPTLFTTGALFFALATVTRSMMATYVGVIALLILYFASRAVIAKLSAQAAVPWLDPFGLGAFSSATKYFTGAERNAIDPPLTGALLGSRILWTALGAAALAAAYPLFRTEARSRRTERRDKAARATAPAGMAGDEAAMAPLVARAPATPEHGARAGWAQLVQRTRFEMALVFRSPAFAVLLLLGLVNAAARLWLADAAYGSALHPVTRLVVQGLRESFSIFPVIVAVYYAGELVWRDRERGMEEIVGSTPARDWTFAAPKMLAIALVLFALMLVGAVAGAAVQALKGGASPDWAELFGWYVVPETVDAAQVAVLAVFLQAISPHKFVGWMLMLLVLVLQLVGAALGWEHPLYVFGQGPDAPLSDMNGQGTFGIARWWLRAYWSGFALVLAFLAYGLWRRGAQTALRPRLARLPARLGAWGGAGLAATAAITLALGVWVFLNTNVLNTYRSTQDDDRRLAEMEKALGRYIDLPQPKITDMVLNVELHPRKPEAITRGLYIVQNETGDPIRELHLRMPLDVKLKAVSVEGGRPQQTFEPYDYRIFTLDTPMAPGERRRVSFETKVAQRGFKTHGNLTSVVENGAFLPSFEFTPFIGMSRQGLLDDRAKRRRYGLTPEVHPPKLEDALATRFSVIRRDADFINSDITVSTDADQTPIAPGDKIADVTVGERRTARFRSSAPILPIVSVQSARYAERHVTYKGVDLGVWYDPHHPWNVDRMLAALKAGLDYDQANFGPYQFRQVRIVEFPDYAQFAISLPNTIPYSEGIGFLFRPPEDPRASDKIDMVTYVTAHELGHQWWGHQVIGAEVQGGSALSETLAQYSALMAMEHLYGPDQIRRFLKYELDRYLRGRGAEDRGEPVLERVEGQGYVHYAKGSLVMYRLKDELGEETVNRALRRVLAQFAFKGAPYPRTTDLVGALRAEAGPEPWKQALITDLWERITLYDLKALAASSKRRPDGRWDVTLKLSARKAYADKAGKEHDAPMDEAVDVGVFTQEPAKPGFAAKDVLALQRVQVRSGVRAVTVTVPREPRFAGVDPYNKLIDRNSDDNLIAVTR